MRAAGNSSSSSWQWWPSAPPVPKWVNEAKLEVPQHDRWDTSDEEEQQAQEHDETKNQTKKKKSISRSARVRDKDKAQGREGSQGKRSKNVWDTDDVF